MTASFLSLLFYYASTRIHETTPLFSIELDIMAFTLDTVMLWVFILIIVIGVVWWICFLLAYGCKWNKQMDTLDEEQGDVVVNREENYESIFVNPAQQPVPSYTPTSLRGSRRSRGSRDTELPDYKPIGTPPPSDVPAYKANSKQPSRG
ncbi:hypothetical protein FDENT_3459 [Fusarium denticulatum]|uniref:Uncharacterized protein n=1 Tax=Fusarium denticulatum TaxID=48507 RepID=A0A8H6CTA2_9HYPO|nr:hypothetical protein FDENT_3459 [Fusarium denticulatum]